MIVKTPQGQAGIQLPRANQAGGAPLRDALRRRASGRDFDARTIEKQTLADLLWCAFGVNRPIEGGRTAPSARNWREIDIYVALPEALYRYVAEENRLEFIAAGDVRALTGVQTYAAAAPLSLIYVADYAKMEGAGESDREFFGTADAAFIAQNVYLFCAGEGLATVVRALIDRAPLAKTMGLRRDQRIMLAQSVGWPAAHV